MPGLAKKSLFVLLVSAFAVVGVSPALAAPSPAPPAPVAPAAPSAPATPGTPATPGAPTAPGAPAAPAAGLVVSTPAGTLPAQPGAVVETWLRIGNTATTPVDVTILPATVKLENNGVSGFSKQEDPRFAGQITFSSTAATVPANGYVEVTVKVAIPAALIPDVYVLGFLVTPAATGSSVRVVNEIGALIALDVPGSRDRKLVAAWRDVPWIIFSDRPSLDFRAKSVGKSALQFTSEDALSGFGPFSPASTRHDPLLLPAGLYRDVSVSWKAPWGVGVHTAKTTLMYPQSQSGNAQIVLTKTVIVVTPFVLMVVGGLLLLITLTIVFLVHRRRRRRAKALKRHQDVIDAAVAAALGTTAPAASAGSDVAEPALASEPALAAGSESAEASASAPAETATTAPTRRMNREKPRKTRREKN